MIPSGWEECSIGSFSKVISLKNTAGESIPVLSMTKYDGFVDSLEYFSKQIFSKDITNYKIVKRGQFAYATIHLDEGSIDFLAERKIGQISPMYTVFEIDETLIDRYWLKTVLKSDRLLETYGHVGQGSINRRKSITFKVISSIKIPTPPLVEQKRIAEILTSVDDAIQATKKVIEQTKRVKQGLLQELLTRGIGHTKFKMTEIGEIPESWEVVKIDKILESSTYGINKSLCDDSSLTPVLRMGNIQENKLSLSGLKYCDVTDLKKEASFLKKNDIIFNRTNSYDLVGKVAIIDTGATLSYASYLIRLRTNEKADPRWLVELLSSETMQLRLKSIATLGVSQCNINPTKMRNLKIFLPSISEQIKMVSVFGKINAAIKSNQNKTVEFQTIKAGLMQDLLTGKVRTRGAA